MNHLDCWNSLQGPQRRDRRVSGLHGTLEFAATE